MQTFKELIIFCVIFAIYFQVRKATADSLYTALITYDDISSEESAEEILNILSETLW